MHTRVDEEITFRKLETLIAFMETGNLARAAERLDVSTVSVHRAVHSLEAGVRCPLYLMRQSVVLSVLRTRERDPILLALLAVCRSAKAAPDSVRHG